MKQYKITTEHLNQDSPDDCVLDPNDPINEIKRMKELAGLGYSPYKVDETLNISHTGMENQKLEKKHNIKPGTPEWFQLWFSKPYLTGEKKIGK
jgi:hypothetical protein